MGGARGDGRAVFHRRKPLPRHRRRLGNAAKTGGITILNSHQPDGAARGDDPFQKVRRRIEKKLAGFTPNFPSTLDTYGMASHKPDSKDFPVPELVLFMLRDLLGWRWYGHGEKVRWTVCGSVAGEPVAFELRKFGFTILRADAPNIPTSRIIGQLQSALKDVEAFLEPYAQAQIDDGEVLIVNRSSEFEGRYVFFRVLAD